MLEVNLGLVTIKAENVPTIVCIMAICLFVLQAVFLFRGLSKKRLAKESGFYASFYITAIEVALYCIIFRVCASQAALTGFRLDSHWGQSCAVVIISLVLTVVVFFFAYFIRILRQAWHTSGKHQRKSRKVE